MKKEEDTDFDLPLGKEETKCNYCGVSYLIHSRVKQLEEKVKQLKAQLKRFEDIVCLF
jgi:DNA-directed RNA polymerase subunit RPC12/RpoP